MIVVAKIAQDMGLHVQGMKQQERKGLCEATIQQIIAFTAKMRYPGKPQVERTTSSFANY